MRISDWSSDVCSSDLRVHGHSVHPPVRDRDLDRLHDRARRLDRAAKARAGGDAELAAGTGGAAGGRPAGLPGVRAAEDQAPSPAPQPQPDAARTVRRQGRRRGGRAGPAWRGGDRAARSEEHTSELQSLMRISYAVFCLKKKNKQKKTK